MLFSNVNAATITAKGIANALKKLPESGKILTEICKYKWRENNSRDRRKKY